MIFSVVRHLPASAGPESLSGRVIINRFCYFYSLFRIMVLVRQ